MDLIQYLKTDDEMKNLRAKWKETFVTPFPPYNWDEYNGIIVVQLSRQKSKLFIMN